MLVLTRKPQESVVVGGSVGFEKMLKVTVLEIGGGKVRLGFDVDSDVPVHRTEVWERLQQKGFQDGLALLSRPPPAEDNGNVRLLNGTAHGRPTEMPGAPVAGPRKHGLLVVDDEKSVRSVLNAGMRQQGFAVWLATAGREAVDLYRKNREAIDIVLLDLRMTEMDGPQTLAELQAINPEVCCCFMSGDLGELAEWKLCNLGAAAVIRKPFHLAEIAEMLRDLATHGKRGASHT